MDVCVIGGGIAGVTASLLLQQAGKRVALLEAGTIGNGVTGSTTAHVTEALDTRWFKLIESFGKAGAKLAAQAQRAAIERIALFVEQDRLDCDFRLLPGYFYSESGSGEIEKEFAAAKALGMQVSLVPAAPLPFATQKAVRFDNQAQFRP